MAENSLAGQLTHAKAATLLFILVNVLNKCFGRNPLISTVAIATIFFGIALPVDANNRIRGEFEYDLDESELSEWQIGPIFLLNESDDSQLELEIPIGQDEGIWFTEPELTYETEIDDFTFELGVGVEVPFSGEPMEPFGSVEGSIDF